MGMSLTAERPSAMNPEAAETIRASSLFFETRMRKMKISARYMRI